MISLIASLLLALVNGMTAPVIAENTKRTTLAAYVGVLPSVSDASSTSSVSQCFHPLAAVRHLFGQARDVGGFFGPKGMSVHLRGKPISHSTQSG